MITGIVEGYGVVTIGSLGFRAEKARIVALVAPRITDQLDILQQYRVPIYGNVEAALAEHPTTKPEDVGINPADYPEPARWVQGGQAWTVPAGAWVVSGGLVITANTTSFTNAMQKFGVTMQQAGNSLAALNKSAETDTRTPLERKRDDAQALAEQRRRAGLRNSGGFDKRGRRN